MNWRDILATACAEQTLRRALSCLGKKTTYQLGGNDNDPSAPFPAACDCSGFVCWCMGSWRQGPPFSDKWVYTRSIWEGGGEVGEGLFLVVPSGEAQPGDLYVFPAPNADDSGHVAIITEISDGLPVKIIHCSSKSFRETQDAVQIISPEIFLQNPQSKIMRPDYEALRGINFR